MTYYIDELKSFSLGSPEVTEAWKGAIKSFEDEGFAVVAFKLPVRMKSELIEIFERIIKDKTK